MTERIAQLEPVPGKETVIVHVGAATFEVAASAVQSLRLEPGLEVGPELHEMLARAAARREAAAQALRYLRVRPRTEQEVRTRLAAQGYPAGVAGPILDELRRQGLVDDERFATWYVTARLSHRPSGAARLMHEMRARGVARPLAEAAVQRALGERSELELAEVAARPRLASARRLGRERGLRRLARFLSGRGFSDETVRRVCLRLFAPGTDGSMPATDPHDEEP